MSLALNPEYIAFKEMPNYLKNIIAEKSAKTILGITHTTKGVFVLLFSHQLNKEFSFIVSTNDLALVKAKAVEVMAKL